MPNGLPTDFPVFDNGDGTQLIWDPTSQSYVSTPIADDRPDRGHATGGDNDLFDPFQHTEQEGVPELEGYMASSMTTPPNGEGLKFQPGDRVQLPDNSMGTVLDVEEPEMDDPPYEDDYQEDEEEEQAYEGTWTTWMRVKKDDGQVVKVADSALRFVQGLEGGVTPDTIPWGEAEQNYYRNAKTAVEWAGPGEVKCPNCANATKEHICPTCGKDLTPEWNQEQGNEFMQPDVEHSDASEFTSWPERMPKPNREKTDNSFPSMNLSKTYEIAQKIAHRKLSEEDWDAIFAGEAPTGKVEIGKWLVDNQGQLHYDHGMHLLHDNIAARDGIQYPADVAALGSVYNDGSADTQRVWPDKKFDLANTQSQIEQAFGPVKLQPPVGMQPQQGKGDVFQPFQISGGQWVISPRDSLQPLTGVAWVKEKSQFNYSPNMILVCEHLQPEDFALFSQGAKAIITATGGLSSHAAYLASTEGIPVVVGIGDAYNKIETGNYLKIDAPTKMITVMPGASASTDPGTKQQVWDSILQHQLQHGGSVKEFAHVDEEIAYNAVHAANLEDCPECSDVMTDQDGEKVCHGCGHKQPIIKHEAGALALAPLEIGAEALGGGAAAEAGGAAAGGGGMGGLMSKALSGGSLQKAYYGDRLLGGGEGGQGGGGQSGGGEADYSDYSANQGTIGHTAGYKWLQEQKEAGVLTDLAKELMEMFTDPKNPLSYVDDAAVAAAGTTKGMGQQQPAPVYQSSTFGEDEVGIATKNRGENSDPDQQSSSGDSPKEHGDSPEQLKDVDGIGGPQDSSQEDGEAQQGDPELQDKATKAYHMNLPLIIEFANSDKPGSENPILVALDQMLEEAFPGYKDGHDQEDGAQDEHPVNDAPDDGGSEDESGEKPEEGDSKEDKKSKFIEISSVFNFIGSDDGDEKAEDEHKDWLNSKAREIQQEEDLGDEDEEKWKKAFTDRDNVIDPQEYGVHASFDSVAFAPVPNDGMMPDQNMGAPGAVAQTPSCPMCGQSHIAGTPCPTATPQQPGMMGQQQMGVGAPVSPQMQPNKIVTNFQVVAFEALPEQTMGNDPGGSYGVGSFTQCPNCGQMGVPPNGGPCQACGMDSNQAPAPNMAGPGPTSLAEHQSPGFSVGAAVDSDEFMFFSMDVPADHDESSDWVDESGAPLEVGSEYEMKTGGFSIPDKVTIETILPHKITFLIHAGEQPYRHEVTRKEIDTDGTTFAPIQTFGGQDSSDAPEEHPVRPGQDPTPQVDDLSTPSTTVSSVSPQDDEIVPLDTYTGSFQGDAVEDRSWILEGSSEVAVDPVLMEKLAGKDFSPREQRSFIDETGEARNLDRLQLAGTHYVQDEDGDPEFALW